MKLIMEGSKKNDTIDHLNNENNLNNNINNNVNGINDNNNQSNENNKMNKGNNKSNERKVTCFKIIINLKIFFIVIDNMH